MLLTNFQCCPNRKEKKMLIVLSLVFFSLFTSEVTFQEIVLSKYLLEIG